MRFEMNKLLLKVALGANTDDERVIVNSKVALGPNTDLSGDIRDRYELVIDQVQVRGGKNRLFKDVLNLLHHSL